MVHKTRSKTLIRDTVLGLVLCVCRQRVFLSIFLLLSLCITQPYSQEKNKKPQDQEDVVSVKTNLVNIDVIVKDKKGKFVSDLKAEDFAVFENGVRQTLEFFEPPLANATDTAATEPAKPSDSKQPIEQPPARPGRVTRSNIISLVLDGQTTDLTNLKRVRDGMLKYIKGQISDTDSVAIFAVTSGLQLLQPFTHDKAKLMAAVDKASAASTSSKSSERRNINETIAQLREQAANTESTIPIQTAAAGSSAAQAMVAARILQQYIQLRTTLTTQQARPILAALAAICEGQKSIAGKKTLVLFSQGFVTPAVLDWQVQSTIDIANRANVTIYIIDSAGLREGGTQSGSLVPGSPLAGVSGITSQEQRIQAVGGETIFDVVRHEGLNREFDILYRVAGDTGGRFVKGNNDISQGLDRIDEEIRSRYTLAYRSTDQNFDGSFRKVKIEVTRPDTQVSSRSGYYAIPHEEIVPLSPDDKKLLAGFAAAEAKPGLPVFVELSPFRSRDELYTVPVSIEVPPEAVKFEQKADKQYLQLDILGVIRLSPDKILSRFGGNFDVGLSSDQYQSILSNDIFYRQDLQLGPGEYDVRIIVRDRLSGKVAAKQERLSLPEMGQEFAASPVVLSRHVAKAASSGKGATDVLSSGAVRIRPSPSHKFRASDNLVMFFELYNAGVNGGTGKSLVRVTVTIMNDEKVAAKPVDYVLIDPVEPLSHLTFAKYVSLAGLKNGTYTAVIESRDMVTRKSVTQKASFVIEG